MKSMDNLSPFPLIPHTDPNSSDLPDHIFNFLRNTGCRLTINVYDGGTPFKRTEYILSCPDTSQRIGMFVFSHDAITPRRQWEETMNKTVEELFGHLMANWRENAT